jgi:hypothetical protein
LSYVDGTFFHPSKESANRKSGDKSKKRFRQSFDNTVAISTSHQTAAPTNAAIFAQEVFL